MITFFYVFIIFNILLFNSCSFKEMHQAQQQAQQIASNLQTNPPNFYTRIQYPTREQSEQATIDYFKREISKIQPDSKSLDLCALIVIPTTIAIENTLLANASKCKIMAWDIEKNYEFFGQVIQKKNIFKKADVKKSDQPKEVIATGYDVVLYPVWNTSAMPWEMEKWYLKRIKDGSTTQIDKAVSQESWLYNIKLAAKGKPQLSSIKESVLPVEQKPVVVADKAYVKSLERRILTEWMSDSGQACRAIEELGRIGDPDTVPTLVKALHLSPPMRISAARALGEMGPKAKAAVPTLKSLINDQSYISSVFDQEFSKAIREEISKALMKIGQ